MHVLVAIPVKPFGVAKARLASRLDVRERARLGRAVAARTVATSLATGAPTAVITADEGVARWAAGLGVEAIGEDPSPGTGLNRAASAAARLAGERDVRDRSTARREAGQHQRCRLAAVLRPTGEADGAGESLHHHPGSRRVGTELDHPDLL